MQVCVHTPLFLPVADAREYNGWAMWKLYISLVKKVPPFLQSGSTVSHSHQLCSSVPSPPCSCQHWALADVLSLTSSSGPVVRPYCGLNLHLPFFNN